MNIYPFKIQSHKNARNSMDCYWALQNDVCILDVVINGLKWQTDVHIGF